MLQFNQKKLVLILKNVNFQQFIILKFIMTEALKKVGNYRLIKRIGHGATAEVFQGRKEGDLQRYAIKMMRLKAMSQSQRQMVNKQISIIKSISHPNIVRLVDSLQTSNNYYLIFEFCEKGDLEKYLKQNFGSLIPQSIIQKIMFCIVDAVRLLHSKGIVHRDIKLANILMKKDFTIKLADFGFAKEIQGEQMFMKTYCGTPITMAPQILLNKFYDKKCDIWSLGIILFQLVYGKLPFSITDGFAAFIQKVTKEPLQIPSQPQMPAQFKQLLKKTLQKNPQNRYDIEQFINNSWIQAGNTKMIQERKHQLVQDLSQQLKMKSQVHEMLSCEYNEEELPKDQEQIQTIISQRIHELLTDQIQKIFDCHEQNRKQIQQLATKQKDIKNLLNFLDWKYIQFLNKSQIKISKQASEVQIKIRQINGLKIPSPLVQKQPKAMKAGETLLKYLKKLSQSQESLETRKNHYQIVEKMLQLLRRYELRLNILFAHYFLHQQLALEKIVALLKCQKRADLSQIYNKNSNFITIGLQCRQKSQKMKQFRQIIKANCSKMTDQIMKKLNGYY